VTHTIKKNRKSIKFFVFWKNEITFTEENKKEGHKLQLLTYCTINLK
jgi:hypothetical protein